MRRATGWTTVLAACMLTLLVRGGAAQQADTAAPARSTLTGVYSAAQAAQGRDLYGYRCQACHTPASHTGPAFVSTWSGRPLWELFGFIRESMPKGDPGSLTQQECAQVLAYLLQMNGMPARQHELPTDSMALKAIRFEKDEP